MTLLFITVSVVIVNESLAVVPTAVNHHPVIWHGYSGIRLPFVRCVLVALPVLVFTVLFARTLLL